MTLDHMVHPSAEQLQAYARGEVPADAADELERHFLECSTCCDVLRTMPEDGLLRLARAAADTWIAHADTVPPPGVQTAATLGPDPTAPGWTHADSNARAMFAEHARYRILEPLGTGGMGAVYKAQHQRMDRIVAVKIIHPRIVHGVQAAERFQREVKAAAKLHHPNVVTAYDADQVGDTHFLVMEHVSGVSLARYLATEGRLSVAQACDCVRQAALGLQHAHENGMVHRDIKPGNLMLTPSGQVKIMDFGLARIAREQSTDAALTREGSLMGTPDYMAPEQANDASKADIRADIYSLGCTLYHLLAGQPPFPNGTHMEKIIAHIEHRPTPIRQLRPEVPEELAAVVERMLAKDPATRFQTPAAVAEALAPFAGGRSPAANRTATRSAAGRHPILIAAGVLAAALLITLGVVVMRIQTEHGMVVVETDDPDVEVLVKQNGELITILNRKAGHQASLRPGKYEVELGPGAKGVKLTSTGFTLTRDGKTVTVRREPVALPTKTPRVIADWKFAVDADGRPVRDGQVVGAVGQSADLNDGIDSRFRGQCAPDGGAPAKYVAYEPSKNHPGLDGFALRTGPKHGGIWFPEATDEDLGTNESFTVWMRVKFLGMGPERQYLLTRPDRWTLSVYSEGTLEVSMASWNDKLIDLMTRHPAIRGKAPILTSLVGKWVDIGFSFHGNANDKVDDTVKVYVNGHPVGTCTGAAKFNYGEVPHLGFHGRGRQERADALFDRVMFFHGVLDDAGFRKLSADADGKLPPPPPLGTQIGEFVGHEQLAMCVAFTPDSTQLLTGSYDRTMRLWDVATRKTVRVYQNPPDGGRTVAFFKDGRRFIVGGDGCNSVRLWDIDQDHITWETKPLPGGITCVALSPDEKHILSAAQDVVLWDAASGTRLGRMPLEPGTIWTVAYSPTQRLALSGAGDGRPRLWDIDKLELVHAFGEPGAPVRSVAFLPDGRRALAGHVDGRLRLWEVATGKALHHFTDSHSQASINQIVVSRDGRFALTAGHQDHTVRVWDLQNLRLVASMRHGDPVEGVALSADGRLVATCSRDGIVGLWRMPEP
jgi:tRNA A-37 threonylcarbamoyl transferase component Bud32